MNKYKSIRTEYNGRVYASKAEAAYAAGLDLQIRAGIVAWWIPQPPVVLDVTRYYPDFLVAEHLQTAKGMGVVICHFVDVKGFETAKFKVIRKLWAKYGPEPLRIVKAGKLIETVERGERR